MKIVLSSKSPRRYEILKDAGFNVIVDPSNSKEEFDDNLDIYTNLINITKDKIKDNISKYPNDLIVSADTIVYFKNKVYGKEEDPKKAYEILKSFSFKKHRVITAVTIYYREKEYSFCEESLVYFKFLTKKRIISYINKNTYKDKAGCYAIQDKESSFIRKYKGEYENIVGFPIKRFKKELLNEFKI